MPRIDRKAQLLEIARRVFAEKGYHDASIDDVIQRAGVARGTFYNYFDAKRALFRQVLEELFRVVWESVQPIRTGPGERVHDQIVANLVSLSRVLGEEHDAARILLAVALGVDPEADRALAGFYASCRARLVRALRKGQTLGIVAPGSDAETLAICIMGTLKEHTAQRLLGIKPPAGPRFLAELLRIFEGGWLVGLEPRRARSKRRAR